VLHNLSLWSKSGADEPDTPLSMDVAMEAAKMTKKHVISVSEVAHDLVETDLTN
jgi:hypothetical protein